MQLIELSAAARIIRNLFNGSIEQILGELLQNSQRAGASKVEIKTAATRTIYRDNGTGLGELADYERLVWIGRSGWDETVTTNQHPYGIGFYAILAHEQVQQVSISSGSRILTIDTQRWWYDSTYSEHWQNLVETVPSVALGIDLDLGVTIEIVTTADWTAKVTHLLPVEYDMFHPKPKIADGYADYFRIHLNDRPTLVHSWQQTHKVLAQTTYLGNPLRIYQAINKPSLVNHYGQLVKLRSGVIPAFDYAITQGTPLDLRSPAREGLVENHQLEALYDFVLSYVVDWLADVNTAAETIDPLFLVQMYIDHRQLLVDCQFYVVDRPNPVSNRWLPEYSSFDDYVQPECGTQYLVWRYTDNAPAAIDRHVTVIDVNGHSDCYSGVTAFLPYLTLPDLVFYVAGHVNQVDVLAVEWRIDIPIGANCNDWQVKPSITSWRLGKTEDWQDCQFPVLCYLDPIESLDWIESVFAYLPPQLDTISNFKSLLGLIIDTTDPDEYYADLYDQFEKDFPHYARQFYPDIRTIQRDFTPAELLQAIVSTSNINHPLTTALVSIDFSPGDGIDVTYRCNDLISTQTFNFI